MSLRRSKYLIRTVLILICFQFTAASFVSGEVWAMSLHVSLNPTKVSKPLTLSTLFEKSETEGEEKNKIFTVELQNLKLVNLNRSASVQTHLRTDIVSQHIRKPSLHGLYCVYLI